MMGSMEDESKPRRRWPTYVAVGIVFVALYLLSSGPVLVLADRGKIPPVPTYAFYKPIAWVANACGIREQYIDYLKWWFRLAGTPGPSLTGIRS